MFCMFEEGSYRTTMHFQRSMSSLPGRYHGNIRTSQKLTTEEPKPSSTGASTGGSMSTIVSLATGLNPAASVFQPSTPTTLWTNGSNAILLQTAQTTAFNPTSPEKLCCIRIVFDSGSQRSYVAEHVVRRLSLASEGEQSLTIMTFGDNEEQACVCNSVRLGLVLKMGPRTN